MKKIVFSLITAAIVAVSGWNVSQNMSDNEMSDVALANVEALADIEALADSESNNSGSYTCTSGALGSSQCSTSANIGGSGTGCSVTCISGYYACCNNYENKCQCRSY